MVDFGKAVFLDDDKLFNAIKGNTEEAVFEYRMIVPFKVDKGVDEDNYKKDDDDVVVYGPVYVGDEAMLDRHKEMVEPKAILDSWKSYMKNPVILYNHRKDYGVIGVMENVEMGSYEDEDRKISTVMGRARIDGGEKDIVRKIRKGMLRSFSIGFIAKAAVKECPNDKEDESCYVRFTNIEWIETSVVDIPASPNALFDVEKSLVSYTGSKDIIGGDGCGGCGCGGNHTEEKHIVAVEETEDSYVIEFGKAEPMGAPDQDTEMEELRQQLSHLEEKFKQAIATDSVNTHIEKESSMSDEQTSEEVIEEVEIKEQEIEVPTEEIVTVKTEEVEEELVEEEVLEEE